MQVIQLSAYTPDKQFSQYILPYMNLNQAAKIKHQVRVINLGIFRMLKNMQTHKVLKTITEYVALKEFMDWLEELKLEKDSKDVVLIFHEQRQFIPCLLLTALNRSVGKTIHIVLPYEFKSSAILSAPIGTTWWTGSHRSSLAFVTTTPLRSAPFVSHLNTFRWPNSAKCSLA